MNFFEVVLLAKKEAETVGRPIYQQLLKYLNVRDAQALHNKYWKELNSWLQDVQVNEIELFKLYQDHVLLGHEVVMDLRYSGNNPKCNQLAMKLYAKLYKKDASKPQGLFAAPSEVNAAIASFKDFCRNSLCCGKRKFAKHIYVDCWRRLNKDNNNFRPNYDKSNSFGGARNDFKTDLMIFKL